VAGGKVIDTVAQIRVPSMARCAENRRCAAGHLVRATSPALGHGGCVRRVCPWLCVFVVAHSCLIIYTRVHTNEMATAAHMPAPLCRLSRLSLASHAAPIGTFSRASIASHHGPVTRTPHTHAHGNQPRRHQVSHHTCATSPASRHAANIGQPRAVAYSVLVHVGLELGGTGDEVARLRVEALGLVHGLDAKVPAVASGRRMRREARCREVDTASASV
jgi:hypothetical protein